MDLIDDLMKELSIDFAELLKRYEQGMVELKIHEINEYSNNRLINYIRECNIFCHACNNTKKYAFCNTKGCTENPNLENGLLVPESVNYRTKPGLMVLLGYKAGKNTKSNERRNILLKILGEKLWTPEGANNSSYVEEFDIPNNDPRRWKMIGKLQGFNVTTTDDRIKENRNQDIEWLRHLTLPNALGGEQ